MQFSHFLCVLFTSAASVAASLSHSASEQTSVIALITVAPGKFERFMELQADTLDYVRQNEPGTLQLDTYVVAQRSNGTEVSLSEKYANAAAREVHQNSKNYARLFATYDRENVLVGMPTIFLGNISQALNRDVCKDVHPWWMPTWRKSGE